MASAKMIFKNSSIEQIMKKSVITVPRDMSILKASRLMDKEEIGCLIVMENGHPIGIVTEKDFLRKVIAQEADFNSNIGDIMNSPLITISRDTDLSEAAEIMTKSKIRRLPVVEGDKLIGIVTMRDLLPTFIDDMLGALDKISDMLTKLK